MKLTSLQNFSGGLVSYRQSPLVKNILVVASGAAAGQMIAFLFSPIITRLYSPEVFGLQGVFLSIISILGPAIALRLPMAIVVSRDDAAAQQLSQLSIWVAALLSCLVFVALAIAQQPILVGLGAEALGGLIWFLPFALFLVAVQDVADYRAARLKNFSLVGRVTVVQAFAINLARVLGGLVAPVAGMLVAVTTLAPALQATLLTLGNRNRLEAAPRLTLRQARSLFREHRDFPVFRVPNDVLNAASQAVPVVLLASLFSTSAAGFYVLTRTVLNVPANLVGAATGNVFYSRFAELNRAGKPLFPLFARSTLVLLLLAPVISGLSWFAPPVFALAFGEEWREAGDYALWMALWIGVAIANVPAIRIAPVIAAQQQALWGNIALLLARVAVMYYVFARGGSAIEAVAAYSVASALLNAGIICVLGGLVWRHDRQLSSK